MRRSAAVLALFVLSPLATAASKDPVIAQAESFLAKRQPNSAYNLLVPLEDERGGDPDFDYTLGVAALDSGRANEAAFAFERCLAIEPKNGPCRVQMARAHMALGENNSARGELQTVNESQPPVEVQNLVAQYLGALNQREVGEKRRIGAWAQIGMGRDSNVNSATADSNILVFFPGGGSLPMVLNQNGVEQSDTFLQGSAGASLQYKLSPAFSILADVGTSSRGYQEWGGDNGFNNIALDGGLGLAWKTGHNSLLTKLQQQAYYLDSDRYRNYTGLLTQYQYALSEAAAFSAYFQGNQLDYRGRRSDATRYTLGTGYSQALSGALSPVFYVGLYGGAEEADNNTPKFNQNFYGARFGGSLGPSRALRFTGSLSVEQRLFDGFDPAVMTADQEDTQIDLSLGAVYQIDPHLSVRPTYTYTVSDSNNPLSDYDRHVVSIDFRYEL